MSLMKSHLRNKKHILISAWHDRPPYLHTLPETNSAPQALSKDISSETTTINFHGPMLVSDGFRSYLLPTRFFFHTLFTGRRFGFLPHSVASSCPVAANQHGPILLKIVEQVFKKNTCLKWWCINIISEKTMLKDYCNSNFAGQKTKEEMVFFLHVRLKMRDWNWDNPSCIHHPWIGIIRCSMIFLYPLVESGCTTDRKKSCPRSQDFLRQQGTSVITCTKHDWKIHPHDSPPAWCWYSSCKLWKKYI